jgi:hypothetical protein
VEIGTVFVDQRTDGGRFNSLGNFPIESGNIDVILCNDASGYVIADAVQVIYVTNSEVIDNSASGFTTVGNWPQSTYEPGYYGSDYQYSEAGDGSKSATWNFDVGSGVYEISAWWTVGSSRAPDAPYNIYNNGLDLDTVRVDQRTGKDQFNLIGNYVLDSGTLEIVLTDDASGHLV